MDTQTSPQQDTNYSEDKFNQKRVSAFNNQEIMDDPMTREPPTPVDRLDYALIMSQEQQEALHGIGNSTMMNTDDDEDIDRLLNRNVAINNNNFMHTR